MLLQIFCYHMDIVSILFIVSTCFIVFSYLLFFNLRYELVNFPLYVLTKLQGKNFRMVTNLKEFKTNFRGADKGNLIEGLIAMPAWAPILSLESVNGKQWEIVRANIMELFNYIPSKEKLGLIAKNEAKYLLNKKEEINSKLISKITLKIFLKWLFCENNQSINKVVDDKSSEHTNNTSRKSSGNVEIKDKTREDPTFENTFTKSDFSFIDSFLTEEFLEKMYIGQLCFRRKLAIKGEGNPVDEAFTITSIVDILKKSKYTNLFEWEKPECYSILMQPFIISPMINIADIACSLKNEKQNYKGDKEFDSYLENCLFLEHPFPLLERYIKETNTQWFANTRTMDFCDKKDAAKINFGIGMRSCLGRIYARELLRNLFEDMINEDFFKPDVEHQYSGKSNDNPDFSVSVYQMKILVKLLVSEFKINYLQ
jgi:hypothetical protein